MNKSALARKLGVTAQHMTNWIARGLPADRYEEMAQALEITVDQLLERNVIVPAIPRADTEADGSVIPQFDTGGSMGGGVLLRDQPGVIRSWNVSPDWVSKNVRGYSDTKNLCIVTGFGDSMRPLFNPGDPLLVDIGVKVVEYDSIYFFRVENEGFIKRLNPINARNYT